MVLFLSISMGIAFYTIGLAEVVVGLAVMPDWLTARMIAVGTILLLFVFVFVFSLRLGRCRRRHAAAIRRHGNRLRLDPDDQLGGWVKFDAAQMWENRGTLFAGEGGTLGFWAVFALFFPAITGLTQGLNMLGDLRRPTRDIPLGTLSAVALSYWSAP